MLKHPEARQIDGFFGMNQYLNALQCDLIPVQANILQKLFAIG